MAQGKPQVKFERNLCIKFRDNCDTDGRRTDKNPIPWPWWPLLTELSRAKNTGHEIHRNRYRPATPGGQHRDGKLHTLSSLSSPILEDGKNDKRRPKRPTRASMTNMIIQFHGQKSPRKMGKGGRNTSRLNKSQAGQVELEKRKSDWVNMVKKKIQAQHKQLINVAKLALQARCIRSGQRAKIIWDYAGIDGLQPIVQVHTSPAISGPPVQRSVGAKISINFIIRCSFRALTGGLLRRGWRLIGVVITLSCRRGVR